MTDLLSLGWESSTWAISLRITVWLAILILVVVAGGLVWRLVRGRSFRNFEIDQAEIGIGTSKFRFKPNIADRQVAYAVWVELSTRKIGLPIDLDHDVIAEIYDSWYNFFSVTRDLIKGIPVSQVRRDSTQKIIRLSIEVLNEGLRPHLTRWQARFRSWYDRELKSFEKREGTEVLDPQQVQARFPQYEELKADLERVNRSLMAYRSKMQQLVMTE